MNSIFKPNHLYLLLISLILAITSCEKEDINRDLNQNQNVELVNFKIASADHFFAKNKNLKKAIGKIKTNMQKSTTSSIYNFGIYESRVQILESNEYNQYTFEVYRDTLLVNQLENYVLRVYEDETIEQYLVKYDKQSDDSYDFNSIQPINDPDLDITKNFGCNPELVSVDLEESCTGIVCTVSGHETGGGGCECASNNTECPILYFECETTTIFVFDDNCSDGGGNDGNTSEPGGPPDGGGGESPTSPNEPSEPGDETIITKPHKISQCTKDAINNLPQDQADWINGLADCGTITLVGTTSCNQELYDDIVGFVDSKQQNCELNGEDESFLNAVKDAMMNDPDVEVDWEDRIIDELDGKEKCINDKLTSTNNDFVKELFNEFVGDDSEFSINIKSKNQIFYENANGETVEVNGITIYSSDSDVIVIEISSNAANGHKALEVVRTLLHEYIHADIFRKMKTINPTSSDEEFRDYFNSYENTLFEPSQDHQTMADLYIGSMVNALSSFHQEHMAGDYNYISNGGQHNLDDFYEALAWRGLSNQNVDAWIDLPQERKDELDQAINQFYHATTYNCSN